MVKNVAIAKKKEEVDIDIFQSSLVPKHEILNGDEKAELLKSLNVSTKQLPRIKDDDPVVKLLQGKKGDVVKITRKSLVAGEYFYYRVIA